MRFADIKNYDVTNGPGVSTSLFVSGCSHECNGCFNKDLWSFRYGGEFTKEMEERFIRMCNDPVVSTISILGGEPLDQGVEMFYLINKLRHIGKPIWLWTGYTFEQIKDEYYKRSIIELVDVVIDGKFEIDKKDFNLKYRGSSNQRIIDSKASLKADKVILHLPAYKID